MDRYKVVKKIGSGAQGEVFLAHDTETGNRVAIKSMLAPSTLAVVKQRQQQQQQTSSKVATKKPPKRPIQYRSKKGSRAAGKSSPNDEQVVTFTYDSDGDEDSFFVEDSGSAVFEEGDVPHGQEVSMTSSSTSTTLTEDDDDEYDDDDDEYDDDDDDDDDESRDMNKLLEEVQWLMTFEHENIVNHFDYFVEVTKSFTGENVRVFVVMEYCDAGDLQSFIKRWYQSRQSLPIGIVKQFCMQLCNCMNFLHANNIIHRDIKAENVMLARRGSDTDTSDLSNLMLKMADFGCTRVLEDKLLKTFQGTIVYMAPEVYDGKRYDESADIWSLGIVIYQILTLTPAEQLPNFKTIIKKSPQFVKHQFIGMNNDTKKIAEIVHWCLKVDPAERPTAQEMLAFLNTPDRQRLRRSIQLRPTDMNLFRMESDVEDVLSEIRSEKGKKFWSDNNFQDYTQIEWQDFIQAYQRFIGYKKLEKVIMRGLKKLLCVKSRNIITYGSFDEAIERVGFPFDLSMVARIEEFMHDANDNNVDDVGAGTSLDAQTPAAAQEMTPEELKDARERYITMIINHDKMFIDPITQQAMNVEKNCVPLRVEVGRDWDELINEHVAMMHHQTRFGSIDTKIDGSMSFREKSESIRKRRSLSTVPLEFGEDAVEFITGMKPGSRAIVVAAAAAGKTVMTKLLLLKSAQMTTKSHDGLIPLYVPISTLCNLPNANNLPFIMRIIRASADAFLNKGLKYADSIERFLYTSIKQGNAFLLFDGLDEASDSTRDRTKQEILQLSDELYEQAVIIITSRATGFEDMYDSTNINGSNPNKSTTHGIQESMVLPAPGDTSILFSQFLLLKLLPLSIETQVKMAKNRGVDDRLFINALRSEKFPSSISSTPLLLSLLIHEFRRKQKLTLNRAELFDQAINTMIDIYMRKKNMHTLSSAKRNKEQIEIKYFLSTLAQMLHLHRKRDFTRSDPELNATMKADPRFHKRWESTSLDIENGFFPLIESLNQTHFRFTHLSFQEYLVAKVWASPSEPSLLRSVKTNKTMTMLFRKQQSVDFSEQFKDKILDPWYRETLMVCVSVMSSRDFKHFVKWILKLYGKNAAMVTPVLMKALDERPPDAVNSKETETQEYLRKTIMKKSKSNMIAFEALLSDSPLLRQIAAKDSNFISGNIHESYAFLMKRLTSDYTVCKEGWRALVQSEQRGKLINAQKSMNMYNPRTSWTQDSNFGVVTSSEEIIPHLLQLVSNSNGGNNSGVNNSGQSTGNSSSSGGGGGDLTAFNDRLKEKVILALASASSAKERDDPQCQKVVRELLTLCNHHAKNVRWACVKALKKIAPLGSREVMEALVLMIEIPNHKEDATYTIQICKALAVLGSASAWSQRTEDEDLQLHMKITNTLLMLLHSEDDRVKMQAIRALGVIIGQNPEDHILSSLSAEFAYFPYWIYIDHFVPFLENAKSFEQDLPTQNDSETINYLLSKYVSNRQVNSPFTQDPVNASSRSLSLTKKRNNSSFRKLSTAQQQQQQQQQQLQNRDRDGDGSEPIDAFVRVLAVSCIVTLLIQLPEQYDTDTLRTIVLQLQNTLNNDTSSLMRLEAIRALSKIYDLIPHSVHAPSTASGTVSMMTTESSASDLLSETYSETSSNSASDLGRLSVELEQSRHRSLPPNTTDEAHSATESSSAPTASASIDPHLHIPMRRKGSLVAQGNVVTLATDKTQHAILNCLLNSTINDSDEEVRHLAVTTLVQRHDPFLASPTDKQAISRKIANLHKALDFATKTNSPKENDLVYAIASLSLSVSEMLDFFAKRYKKKSNRTIIFDVFVKRVRRERKANKDWSLSSTQLNLLQSLKYPEAHFMLIEACR